MACPRTVIHCRTVRHVFHRASIGSGIFAAQHFLCSSTEGQKGQEGGLCWECAKLRAHAPVRRKPAAGAWFGRMRSERLLDRRQRAQLPLHDDGVGASGAGRLAGAWHSRSATSGAGRLAGAWHSRLACLAYRYWGSACMRCDVQYRSLLARRAISIAMSS